MFYQIIESRHSLKLVEKVNEELKKGWLPLGGVAISCWFEPGASSAETLYVQAMTKRE